MAYARSLTKPSFNSGGDAGRILAAILESSDDAIVVTDLEGAILEWNPGAERLFGFAAADIRAKSVATLVPRERQDHFSFVLDRLRLGQSVRQYETSVLTKSGALVDVVLSMSPVTDPAAAVIGAAILARDISARKYSDLALRASELRWRSVVESAVDAIIVIDAYGRIDAFNPAAERLFGYGEADVVGQNVSLLMPSPYHEEHDGYLAAYLATGVAKIIGVGREVTGRRRDGSTFPLHLSVGEMSTGGERKFTGILHDLTSRVRLEAQLRASEARWRAVIESAVDGIVVIDPRGCIEAFNPAAERLFGYSEGEVIGKNVSMLMPEPYHHEHDGYLRRYVTTGAARIIGIGREVTGLRRDRSTFPLHLSVGEVSIGGERKFTGILHDLSRRVQMEEQLREQATLARLGEMAAVIAHEVKNPLAGIRGAIQIIGSRLGDRPETRIIGEIVGRIDALDEMMKDMLLFARPPRPRLLRVEVALLVASTAELLRGDPAIADVQVEVEGAAPPIEADPELLKIVFLNLLVNGAHAIGGRGRLQVSMRSFAETCEIVFSDSGPGMPLEVQEKIFTPFFTTKARGTGLGLPTAKRLIEAHRGTIAIECPPGGGTSVTIRLPVLDSAAADEVMA